LKKFIAVILGVLFVLSFAASAFAVHAEIPAETQAVIAKGTSQVTLGGHWRTRGWYRKNIAAGDLPLDATSSAHLDSRIRLTVNVQSAANVQGFMSLQTGSVAWGTGNRSGGQEPTLLEGWIYYTGSGLLGVPAGIKVGHMPLALGHKLFFDHTNDGDDAIVITIDPTKQTHISLLGIKLAGDGGRSADPNGSNSASDNTDDVDAYVGLIDHKLSGHTIGANYTYMTHSDTEMSFSNLGLHAHGDVAGFGYKAAVNLQFGEVASGIDAEGWAVELKANYKINAINLKGMFGYGSGDPEGLADGDQEEFVTSLSDTVYTTFIYDYLVDTTANNATNPSNQSTQSGLANTTIYMIGLDYQPTKALSTYLNGFLIEATETLVGQDDEAGWEVDAGFVYTIARNLKYYLDVGYFEAGDFYGPNAESVTAVKQQLILSF
jgi:hypothetical protein